MRFLLICLRPNQSLKLTEPIAGTACDGELGGFNMRMNILISLLSFFYFNCGGFYAKERAIPIFSIANENGQMVLHCVIPKDAISIEIQKDTTADFDEPMDMRFNRTVSLPFNEKISGSTLYHYRVRGIYKDTVSLWNAGIATVRDIKPLRK